MAASSTAAAGIIDIADSSTPEAAMTPELAMAGRDSSETFRTHLVAGTAAALVGVAGFGIFHTIWIANIPAVFIEGLAYAVPTAPALAWLIGSTRRAGRFRGGPRDGMMLGFLLWLTVVPYEIAGVLGGPWPELTSFAQALPLLWIAFLGVPVGAVIGWLLTGRARPAAAWAVAALAVNFSIGGGIAFFGGRGTFLGLFLWLLPTHVVAGAALTTMASRLASPRPVPIG